MKSRALWQRQGCCVEPEVGASGVDKWQPSRSIIDGKAIAAQVREEAKQRADKLHERGITPGLALVLAGENPSSLSYVRSKGDAAEQAGIYSDMFQFPENVDGQTLLSRILDLNDDGRFHGILVQLPLPKHLDENAIINAIDPAKDADGVTPMSLGRLLRGEPGPWPATPAGIVELLHRSGHPPAGKHVVVCGRSNIVGKPVAAILMQKSDRANATVTVCHTGDARPRLVHAPRGHPDRGDGIARRDHGGDGEAGRCRHRCRQQLDRGREPAIGPPPRRRRGLRGREGGGGRDHAGAGRRRADDGGDAAFEHGDARRAAGGAALARLSPAGP